ncbi:MAG TPA: DEAD/DEAH box helicase [Candidatus Nanoarchaeia archaeon]|nr:DEAD/DEAH box helicase [Candidatus Nanoarchaeia archaeon]
MLKDFTPRLYQQTILYTSVKHNTLVVLPTGLGKTACAFLLAAQRMNNYPNSKILMLAPTKPLCEQHVQSFQKHLAIDPDKVVLFTGNVRPDTRAEMWKSAQIIISTPQGLENDIINQRIRLAEVSLLIFDECHHATGEYAYVWIAEQYDKQSNYGRILALTASPGSDLEKIKEVCANLKIDKVEVRTESDPDVKPYLQTVKLKWVKVPFPEEFKSIRTKLKTCIANKLIEIKQLGCSHSSDLNKSQMLGLQLELQKEISSGELNFEALRSISLLAEALKVEHALELLESQGIKPLTEYFDKLQSQAVSSKVKAVKNLVLDELFKESVHLTNQLLNQHVQHPKQAKLKELVQEVLTKNQAAKIIIFTQFRDTAEEIVTEINNLRVKNHIFVGQAKKKGLGFTQKQQKEVLDNFRQGQFSVLIATSVAEEGLDIPKVDKVIFYEPIPSAVRSIQRRGRTGRLEQGEVTILVTEGTRDEAYRWSSVHKEKRMYRNLEQLKRSFSLIKDFETKPIGNTNLNSFVNNTSSVISILADHREKDNKVVKELIELNVAVKTAQLNSADYILSGQVGVELKKIPDFVASIIDGRLLDQMKELRANFPKSILIIEGEEDIYGVRKIHPNAIRGMLASITLDFNIPILYTKNPQDTALLLAIMAKREQGKDSGLSLPNQKPSTISEQQEYFISSLPGIGLSGAKKILEQLQTIKNLVNSNPQQLQELEGIGPKTAEKLVKLFTAEYNKK